MALLVVLAAGSLPSVNANIFERVTLGMITSLDPSAISQGMGGASAAVFWSAEPNYWANPALLGYYQGARWQWGRSRLSPGLPDVRLTSDRYTVAAYGIGIENAGRPVGMGNTHLEEGTVDLVDQSGNLLSRFQLSEEVEGWTVGVSLARLIGSAATLSGHEAPWILRYVDLAAGMAKRQVRLVDSPWLNARAEPTDHGFLLRGGVDSDLLGWKRGLPFRADLALAVSRINANDARFQGAGGSSTTTDRYGYATHVSLGLPPSVHQRARSRLAALALDGLEPMVSVGLAYDHELDSAGGLTFTNVATQRMGGEVAILNVLSLRLGYVSDDAGDLHALDWGFGVALPVGDVAGFRYDYGHYGLAEGFGSRSPWSVSGFVDPVALARRLTAE
jgi:hypothetical protein